MMTEWGDGTPKRKLGWRGSPGTLAEDLGCLGRTLGGTVEGLGEGHNTIGCNGMDVGEG